MREEGSRGFFLKKKGDLRYSGTVAPPAAAAPGDVHGRRELQKGGKRREKNEEERERAFKNEKTGPKPLYRGWTGSVFSLNQTGPVLPFWPVGLISGPPFFLFFFFFWFLLSPPLFLTAPPFSSFFFTRHIYFMSCIFYFMPRIFYFLYLFSSTIFNCLSCILFFPAPYLFLSCTFIFFLFYVPYLFLPCFVLFYFSSYLFYVLHFF